MHRRSITAGRKLVNPAAAFHQHGAWTGRYLERKLIKQRLACSSCGTGASGVLWFRIVAQESFDMNLCEAQTASR